MSDALKQDLRDFLVFCTKRQWAQQHEPIAPITAHKYVDHLRWSKVVGSRACEQCIRSTLQCRSAAADFACGDMCCPEVSEMPHFGRRCLLARCARLD